jgi:hypothetical protein
MHEPISLQGKWLRQVVRGYFAYHAVRTNCKALSTFRHYVMNLWRRALQRRSQRDRSTWERIAQLAREFLPLPRILHPGRAHASPSNTQGGSPVRESRTPGSVRGVLSNEHPYRDSPTLKKDSGNGKIAGDYIWHANRRVAKGSFRPLRQPREAAARWLKPCKPVPR